MKTLEIEGKKIQAKAGTTYLTLAKQYQENYERPIVLVRVNNRLRELGKQVAEDGTLEFITTADKVGVKAYRRSVSLLLQKAVYDLYGKDQISVHVMQTIGNGQFCELQKKNENGQLENCVITDQMLSEMIAAMHASVRADLTIHKESRSTADAIALFHEMGMVDKEKLFGYRRSSSVNIYELDGYRDYFYGYMVPSTGFLKKFELVRYRHGMVLLYPNPKTGQIDPFAESDKLFDTQYQSSVWGQKMGIKNIGELNDAIAQGRIQDIILMQEAEMEARLSDLAAHIAAQPDKKFVMIAGPSSSGKTTFSHRLSIQLTAHGKKPHPIGLDNYYVDREKTPLDENGKYDFECLEAVDIELFNRDMTALLKGEQIEMPVFNFKTGKREYRGNFLQLGPEDILVIEGIHGLNDKLSYSLPCESKFKIYISALTQLAIDEHNALPTTDGRLLRRIVRDARTRGTSAKNTIAMWDSVRRGEEKNIFPFQEEADYVFNSALIYELAVLKVYAEPQLFNIPKDCPEYIEAKRLLKFLDYFLAIPSEVIQCNSLLREFIGGGCFNL